MSLNAAPISTALTLDPTNKLIGPPANTSMNWNASSITGATTISATTVTGTTGNFSNLSGSAFGTGVTSVLSHAIDTSGGLVSANGGLYQPGNSTLTAISAHSAPDSSIYTAWVNAVNSANAFVVLTAADKYPALDGSLITNITASSFSGSLAGDVTGTQGATVVGKIGGKTVTLGGNFTTSGAFNFTGTLTGTTSVTFPTSGTLASSTNNLGFFASTTSAQLAGIISDETGTGSLVFGTTPTITTPVINGTPSGTAFGTGVATALGNAIGSMGGLSISLPYSSGFTYSAGAVTTGSDGNSYRALGTTTGNDPTTDNGANWELALVKVNTTLNIPSRFASIGTAWTFITHATIVSAATVTIKLADGTYNLGTTQYLFNHPQGSNIQLIGDVAAPASCILNFSGLAVPDSGYIKITDGFIAVTNGHSFGLIDGFTINGPGGAPSTTYFNTIGIMAYDHSFIKLCSSSSLIVNNFYSDVANFYHSSIDLGTGLKATGGADGNIWAYQGGNLIGLSVDTSGAGNYFAQSGVLIEHGSSAFLPNLNTHNNGGTGVQINYGSSMFMQNSTNTSNNYGIGMQGDSSNYDDTGSTYTTEVTGKYLLQATALNYNLGIGTFNLKSTSAQGTVWGGTFTGADTTWLGSAVENTNTSGFAGWGLLDTTGTLQGGTFYGNSGAAPASTVYTLFKSTKYQIYTGSLAPFVVYAAGRALLGSGTITDDGVTSLQVNSIAGNGTIYGSTFTGADATWVGIAVKNTSTSGFASMSFLDNSGASVGIVGHGNSAVGGLLANNDYCYQYNHDWYFQGSSSVGASGYNMRVKGDGTGIIVPGNINSDVVGFGYGAKEGSNAKQGTATLSGGTIAVSNTSVTSSSRIFLGYTSTVSANVGALFISSFTAGSGFTVKSTNSSDTSVIAYEIFEPAP